LSHASRDAREEVNDEASEQQEEEGEDAGLSSAHFRGRLGAMSQVTRAAAIKLRP
jgi:hypothetical protein